ncbi:hypothetical protein DDB_G0290531 [Dictyostelium discoideum AX4]|uniref:Uncharacterized protein n=1 Tax=Dictyostelium discoideum TaxID=44689 RepID=Q54FY5_DICDI|nr:hypothetical protein DDB_G0290531 [Dictyostelium discoideum AX4]EAL62126.1 hypothetical protein DDB_G0290531 [Dictyostelium discoideum AX4]|eukprot:XP_635632.1 hypothetical protein DDB_G0290531 [Dictyostelium discoideum AX4]
MNTSKTLILANNFRNQFNRRITTYSTFTLSQVRGKDGKLYTVPPKHWEEGISTPSESIVKAERAPPMPIEELQRVSAAKFSSSVPNSQKTPFLNKNMH